MGLTPLNRATAANVGSASGAGIFRDRVGLTLNLRKLTPLSSKITFLENGDDVDVDVNEAELTVFSGGDRILDGGAAWDAGLTFNVSKLIYVLNGDILTSAEQVVTLDASDPTDPRIDVIYVDVDGNVGKITGVANPDPSKPNVGDEQLEITFVLIAAGATTPSITTYDIYLEGAGPGTEWTVNPPATIDPVSVADAFSGSKSLEGTNVVSGNNIDFIAAAPVDLKDADFLELHIKNKSAWPNNRRMLIHFYYNGSMVTRTVTVRNNRYGLDRTNTSDWQTIVIPKADFGSGFNSGAQTVDRMEIRFRRSGSSPMGFFMDQIRWQIGIPVDQPVPSFVNIRGDTGTTSATREGDTLVTTGDEADGGFITTIVTDHKLQVKGVKHNFTAIVDPTVADDSVAGYNYTSKWYNTAGTKFFECNDPSSGAAEWYEFGQGAAPAPAATVTPSALLLQIRMVHFSDIQLVNWHLKFDLSELDDISFASPIISGNSQSDQSDWLYRLDSYGESSTIDAMPPSGVPTNVDIAREDRRVATAFYPLPSGDLSSLISGKTYWLRSYQSPDQGDTWGDPLVEPIVAP